MYYKQTLPDVYQYAYHHNHIRFSTEIYRVGTYHYNWHPETEVLLILQGRLELVHDRERTVLGPLDIACFSPQTGHATMALDADTVAMVMHIHPTYWMAWDKDFSQYYFYLQTDASTLYSYSYSQLRFHLAKLALRALETPSPLLDVAIESHCTAILSQLYQWIVPKRVLRNGSNAVQGVEEIFSKMVNYIERNYQHKIEMEDVARIGGYNVSYASQFFKRQMGITFGEYLMRLRLREATVALVNGDDRIVDIANRSGFVDVKAFNTAFKKHFRKTPSQYRVEARRREGVTSLNDWKTYVPLSDLAVRQQLEALCQRSSEDQGLRQAREVKELAQASLARKEALASLREEVKRLQEAVEQLAFEP